MKMENFKITDLIEELRNDPSWCEDEAKRNELLNVLVVTLMTT
jgi:hypothetical protein